MAEEKELIIDHRELGASGLRRFGGFIYEEFLLELQGWRGCRVYKEMSNNDPTVGAVLFAIRMLCRRVPWRVQPASNEPADLLAAEFLKSCMDDMSQTWIDTIDEILSMLIYGYSPHEIVYKRRRGDSQDPSMRSKFDDGRIGWRKLPIRAQDTIFRWHFDDNGGIQALEQIAPPHYKVTTIPMEKLLLFRTEISKNNPEGRSILRTAYRPWYLKKNIENIEGIGIERDLAGLPTAMVPPELLSRNASTDQKNLLSTIREIITNIRRDEQEGVIFPMAYNSEGKPLYELKLLSTGGSRQFDTDKIISRYDQRIAMASVADFLLIGQQAVGSFALVDSKTNLFATAVGGFLDMVCGVFNRYGVPRLFMLNPDLQISKHPEIVHGDLENVNLKDLGDYVNKLSMSGMPLFPDTALENYLRKVANLPELPDDKASQSMIIPSAIKPAEKTVEIPATPPVDQLSGLDPFNQDMNNPQNREVTNITEQEEGELGRHENRPPPVLP